MGWFKWLESVAKYSPESFYKLKLLEPLLLPGNLESFLISWKNRASKKSLSLIVINDYDNLKRKRKNMKIIEKYKNLGVIKKFETREYKDDEI